jgi:hypothetical protein
LTYKQLFLVSRSASVLDPHLIPPRNSRNGLGNVIVGITRPVGGISPRRPPYSPKIFAPHRERRTSPHHPPTTVLSSNKPFYTKFKRVRNNAAFHGIASYLTPEGTTPPIRFHLTVITSLTRKRNFNSPKESSRCSRNRLCSRHACRNLREQRSESTRHSPLRSSRLSVSPPPLPLFYPA